MMITFVVITNDFAGRVSFRVFQTYYISHPSDGRLGTILATSVQATCASQSDSTNPPMHIFNYFTLVGAVALLAHFTLETDAFTLGRNMTLVIDDDSHETTTDNLVDSAERNQTSSTEDHSLEVINSPHLVVKRNPLPATVDQQPVQIHVDVSDYSWEDLIENVVKLDDTKAPVDSQPPTEAIQQQQQQIVIDYDDSLEDLLEDVAAHHIHGTAQTVSDVELVPVQQVPADGSPPTWNDSTSSVLVIQDDYDDDFSLEDYTEFVNPDAVQLTATDFHHLPETLFTHPTSDDWFLVKHFMDDHYVWELGDELVKEYFWQPVKASDSMNIQHQQTQK